MLAPDQYFAALAPAVYADIDKRVAVQAMYPLVQEQVSAGVWGVWTNKAVTLWSLHLWAFDVDNDSNEAKGALIAAETGESSKKRWEGTTGGLPIREDFELTKWGRQYLSLRRIAYGPNLFRARI